MLKAKSKILLMTLFALVLVSSCCFATVEPRVAEEDNAIQSGIENIENSIQNELMTITEQGQEPITTTGDEVTQDTIAQEDETASWTNSDLYVAEDTVTISNIVDGNAFVIGKDVTISGEIGGDLFVIADKLTIDGGYIYSSIFACANEITINGVVYDVYAMCNTFNLESNGYIYRDMKVMASTVNLNGSVRRNAYIQAGDLHFAEGIETSIYGNLEYSSEKEISIPDGAVAGEVKYTEINQEETASVGSIILSYVTDLIATLFFTFVIALVFLWLTPNFVERVGKMGVAKSFASLGIGIIAPLVLIFVGLLLLFSSIGASIFVCGIFATIVLFYLGFSVTSIFFGKLAAKLVKWEGNTKFVLLTLGVAIILWALTQIPFVGGFLSVIITLFGVGTTLVNIVDRKEKAEKKVEEK